MNKQDWPYSNNTFQLNRVLHGKNMLCISIIQLFLPKLLSGGQYDWHLNQNINLNITTYQIHYCSLQLQYIQLYLPTEKSCKDTHVKQYIPNSKCQLLDCLILASDTFKIGYISNFIRIHTVHSRKAIANLSYVIFTTVAKCKLYYRIDLYIKLDTQYIQLNPHIIQCTHV